MTLNEEQKKQLREDREKCGIEAYFGDVMTGKDKKGKPQTEKRIYLRANSFSLRRNEITMRAQGFEKDFVTLENGKQGFLWKRVKYV